MSIVLTMDEIKNIVEKEMNSNLFKFKKLSGSQRRHIGKEWRDYLDSKNMTIEDYNKMVDEKNEISIEVAKKLRDKISSYTEPKKVFRYLNRLSRELGDINYEYRQVRHNIIFIEFMGNKKHLRRIHANHFGLILGIENNARNMGFKDYDDLVEYKNIME